jgi:hypothetical protein
MSSGINPRLGPGLCLNPSRLLEPKLRGTLVALISLPKLHYEPPTGSFLLDLLDWETTIWLEI